ncbi:hypothetical protein SAT01_28680 [Sinomonas atrocyanea]|uniref:hypothetical protein n=1 Tax=Sinomonas atrocyanea TaxID=37927 RepID=UPI00082CB749|nr:hypothetical protein [Sinomonas atrocyanea]GEB65420.1 hypothetical protein SAT01_28680 [Sinomonas atrocyanea]GGG65995.1 hypothetical protein GCM10007172_16910 [Sinomonas atrocyanea]
MVTADDAVVEGSAVEDWGVGVGEGESCVVCDNAGDAVALLVAWGAVSLREALTAAGTGMVAAAAAIDVKPTTMDAATPIAATLRPPNRNQECRPVMSA